MRLPPLSRIIPGDRTHAFRDPAVLYENSDIAELESAVQKGGVKGLSERNRGGLHSCHGLGDPRRICEDIGDIDGDQSDDDHDGQNGRDPAHQVGSEDGHDENKDADDQGAEQIRQSRDRV